MSYLYSKLPETGVSPHIGTGGSRRAIYAVDVRRRLDVANAPDEIGRRCAKGKPITHPADRERIAPAVKY